jgi:hypothetical protein
MPVTSYLPQGDPLQTIARKGYESLPRLFRCHSFVTSAGVGAKARATVLTCQAEPVSEISAETRGQTARKTAMGLFLDRKG